MNTWLKVCLSRENKNGCFIPLSWIVPEREEKLCKSLHLTLSPQSLKWAVSKLGTGAPQGLVQRWKPEPHRAPRGLLATVAPFPQSPEFMQMTSSLLKKYFSGEFRSVFSFPEINTFVYLMCGTFTSPETNTLIRPRCTKLVLSSECLSLEALVTVNIFRSTMCFYHQQLGSSHVWQPCALCRYKLPSPKRESEVLKSTEKVKCSSSLFPLKREWP